MKNREQLWEDYEEARFALLMDALAEAEGEEALRLSEALNRDPEGALPPEVDRRCEAVIRGAFVQRRLHATGRTAVRWLTKVLVAAMLGAVMFAAAFALSEDVRVATLNAVIKVMDDRTQITFESAGGDAGGTAAPPAEGTAAEDGLEYHYNIALEWVPEGFELEGGIEGGSDLVSYLSPVDGLLEVSVTPYSQSSVYNLNTEGCTKQEITVQGHPAELYVTGEEMLQKRFSMTGFDIWSDMMIYWIDENNRVIVQIDATNLTEEEMIRLAEGFHWGGGQ